MERLDACYFCGTAADAPLREVSISPRAKRGDPDATVRVTLCPSCERKLERVLDGLFDHVESRRVEREDPDEVSESPPAETADAHEPTRSTGGGRVDRIDISSDGSTDRQGRRRLFTEPPEMVDRDATDSADDPVDPGKEDDDGEILADEPRVRARATSNRTEGLADVSLDEYNRVIRLLQNRAFPIARETFVDLAADAYDLGEDTVEQVIDAAIEGGSLAERDGQLVRPDGKAP